ncbi:hypothetical protein MMC30_001077 [Trapelia coarctata]|nr:hypothetical protein [Trapelia coarctata]
MPELPGMEKFGKPLFHSKEWALRMEDVENAATVGVLGGSKSAIDVASFNAARGAKVHWIIRKSGFGPGWTSPTRVTPFKIRLHKLITARFLTCFGPCIWAVNGYSRFRKLLHGSWLGRKIVAQFYANMENDMINLIGYNKHPETPKHKPWSKIFWHGADVSVLNYTEDMIAQVRRAQVQGHIADTDHLEPRVTHLSDGSELPADVLVCATGWKFEPPVRFSGAVDADLGLPLAEASNPEMLVATRNIVFAVALHNVTTCLVAQAQALWITAYFDDKLDNSHLPSEDAKRAEVLGELEFEAYLHT